MITGKDFFNDNQCTPNFNMIHPIINNFERDVIQKIFQNLGNHKFPVVINIFIYPIFHENSMEFELFLVESVKLKISLTYIVPYQLYNFAYLFLFYKKISLIVYLNTINLNTKKKINKKYINN